MFFPYICDTYKLKILLRYVNLQNIKYYSFLMLTICLGSFWNYMSLIFGWKGKIKYKINFEKFQSYEIKLFEFWMLLIWCSPF